MGYVLLAVALIILVAIGWYYQKKDNLICRIVAWIKLQLLRSDVKYINELYINRVLAVKKKTLKERVHFIKAKKQQKTEREQFEASAERFKKYTDFCGKYKCTIDPSVVDIPKKIEEVYISLLTPDEYLNYAIRCEEKAYSAQYLELCKEGEGLHKEREKAAELIEDIEEFVNTLANSPKSFDSEFEKIKIEKTVFKRTLEYAGEQKKTLENMSKVAATGAAVGAGVATIGPSAALWVATTFGTASTGTAISALSGAAAGNAALAWLGGGAVAAGGGGMAAGNALLALAGPVGWGIAGASVLSVLVVSWCKKNKILNAKKRQVEAMKRSTEALKETGAKIIALSGETSALTDNLKNMFSSCKALRGMDYSSFNIEQKEILAAMVNNTKALSCLLNKTVTE